MHKRKLQSIFVVTLAVVIITAFSVFFSSKNTKINSSQESTASYKNNKKNSNKELAIQYKKDYKKLGIDYTDRMVDYNPFGSYFHYGSTINYKDYPLIGIDSDGIPKLKVGNKLCLDPVTFEQYALNIHDKYLNTKDDSLKEKFLSLADKLIEMQSSDGSLRYNFTWKYYLQKDPYKPGWICGMAQGQALSVWARAYYLTKDTKYIKAGSKAINFLIKPISQGGCMDTLKDLKPLSPSLRNNIIFEEYISTPSSYTLNGFMFTLLGLYDWTQLDTSNQSKVTAQNYLQMGIKTLKIILPYYDIGGFSVYDLSYITYKRTPKSASNYHAVHIQLLNALSKVTGEPELKEYEKKWTSDISNAK